jgi:hypothetical protein
MFIVSPGERMTPFAEKDVKKYQPENNGEVKVK